VSEFSDVLAQVAGASRIGDDKDIPRFTVDISALSGPIWPAAGAGVGHFAAARYAAFSKPEKLSRAASIAAGHFDFECELEHARGAPKALRALRRKVAWRYHPDRRMHAHDHASEAMARCNARIDAEISKFEKY